MASRELRNKESTTWAIFLEAFRVGLRRRHFWQLYILGILLIYCSLFYYFGELAGLFRWESLRLDFFNGAHDIQRALFLIPVVYSGYTFGVKGAAIVILLSSLIVVPRFLLPSAAADSIIRVPLFIIFAGIVGFLSGVIGNKFSRRQKKV